MCMGNMSAFHLSIVFWCSPRRCDDQRTSSRYCIVLGTYAALTYENIGTNINQLKYLLFFTSFC